MIQSNGSIAAASIDTLGDTTPMFSNGSYYSSNQLELSGAWAAYGALYRQQLWVGTVVRKLGMATARMPFDIKLRGKGTETSPEAGDLTELMDRPNPKLSGLRLWLWTSSTFDIYGEAFWLKLRDTKGRVRELHPVHPTNLVIHRNTDGDLEYLYNAGSRTGLGFPPIAYDDIVPFTTYNPENMYRGLSNLEGLRMTLLNEDASRRATASFWRRGARPSQILSVPKTLSDTAHARLKADFAATNSGADNFGSTAILEDGVTASTTQLNLEEMQYIESRKLNREEVCAAYDVPPPVVHILDKATFSNITEQLRSQYRDTMAPRFSLFESVVDHHLLPDFYSYGQALTRFNMDDVLRGDFESRAIAVGTLIEKGVLMPGEARPMFNLAPAGPEADKLYANAALVPLGSNGQAQQVATDGTLIPTPLPPVKAMPLTSGQKLAVRSIMGRLGQVKSNKAALKGKLVDEHSKALASFFAQQRDAVKAAVVKGESTVFDPADWDDQLAETLHTLATATTQAIGTKTATDLGSKYSGDDIVNWLSEDAKTSAANINKRTGEQLDAVLAPSSSKAAPLAKPKPPLEPDTNPQDDSTDVLENPEDEVDAIFDGPVAARANEIALSRVTMLAGFAALLAGQQSNATTKTWIVTSASPRASHAAMDGETVGIEETFSNGMNGPGDFTGGADEVAGCTCDLQFTTEEN